MVCAVIRLAARRRKKSATKRCRPENGFKKGQTCGDAGDCDAGAGNFCYIKLTQKARLFTKRADSGICADKKFDYEGCTANQECRSNICTRTNDQAMGRSCDSGGGYTSQGPNCQCRPVLGFRAGQKSASADDCKSRSHVSGKDGWLKGLAKTIAQKVGAHDKKCQ